MAKVTATREQYEAVFGLAARQEYPTIDAFVNGFGFPIDEDWMLRAAKVMACPVKANPPCWQHGRVLYSALRAYCDGLQTGTPLSVVDIGTAKGFSAIVMARALEDAGHFGDVVSIDVLDPQARVRRNTIAEIDGLRTLYEVVAPWKESRRVKFVCAKAENWLMMNRERMHFAFVDGKHSYDAVKKELGYLAQCQESGDVVVCDDLQIPGVSKAIYEQSGYEKIEIYAHSDRGYVVMEKK